MLHTFDGPFYTKMRNTLKNCDYNDVFQVFLIFRVAGPIESMQHGYSFDEELNFASNEYSCSKFE